MLRVAVPFAVVLAASSLAPAAQAKPPINAEVAVRTALFDLIDDARTAMSLGPLGFDARLEHISGNDPSVTAICENVGSVSGHLEPVAAAQKLFSRWDASAERSDCMFDRFGSAAGKAGIGIQKDGRWWATFVAAD
jgi:hypothetical protein